MKKNLIYILIITAAVFIAACNPLIPINLETSRVTIDTGIDLSAAGSKAVPTGIASFKLTVTAVGMTTVENTFTEESVSLEIEAGTARTFTLEALDAAVNVMFSGSTTLDLTSGQAASVAITMSKAGFNITFNTNGGSAITAVFAADNSLITAPAVPTKAGYTFTGWYSDSDLKTPWVFTSSTVTADMTLYAKWTAAVVSFTVSFDSNGGSGLSAQIVEEGSTFSEPIAPTRLDYVITGWYTDDGTFLNSWDFGIDKVAEDMTLYANWIAGFNITYVLDGVTNNDANPASYATSSPTIILADASRDSWTFTGWYSEATFITPFTEITTGSSGALTLYGKWSSVYPGTLTIGSQASIAHTGGTYYADYWKLSFSVETEVTLDLECTDYDSYLAIHDDSTNLLVQIDDGGEGVDARWTYTFLAGVVYYIEAATLSADEIGDYVLELSSQPPDVFMELATKPY